MPLQRVLFVCLGNACRSQMAEGWLRRLAGERFEAFSAGTQPAGLNSQAVAAMREIGIDISHHRSKRVSALAHEHFDHVITVCNRARESCPLLPDAKALHWDFDDPASAKGSPEDQAAVFRRVRDEIAARIRQFLDTPAAGR